MEKLLLRPSEAAEALGIGRSKAYELLAAGVIPSVRLGRSIRVRADVLREWVGKQGQPNEDDREQKRRKS